MSENEQGFAVVKNAKIYNQEVNIWEFQTKRISYISVVATFC